METDGAGLMDEREFLYELSDLRREVGRLRSDRAKLIEALRHALNHCTTECARCREAKALVVWLEGK
jgi:hypothetical protein